MEDATRGTEQRFAAEAFLVRSWMSIRRLLWPVARAFWWLNLRGENSFGRLRRVLMNHPWRLKKEVTYLFDRIAAMRRELLHPHPKLAADTGRTPDPHPPGTADARGGGG